MLAPQRTRSPHAQAHRWSRCAAGREGRTRWWPRRWPSRLRPTVQASAYSARWSENPSATGWPWRGRCRPDCCRWWLL